MHKYILVFLLLCLHGLARGQTDGYSCYYWFDYQQGKPQTLPLVQGPIDVDVTSLADGIHTFHYLVAKADGAVSASAYSFFLKATSAAPSEQLTCLCTIDGELIHQELLSSRGGTIHWNLNVGDIPDGLHKLQIDALMADGAMSGTQHGYFVKVPNKDAAITGFYWFDDEADVRKAPIANGTFEVDVSSLSDGFHRFNYNALQANGISSNMTTSYFLKTAQVNPDDELTCICTVDNQLRHIEKLPQQGGIIHWNLDMQDLTDGVHKIQLQAVTPSGALSTSYSSYFMRVTSTEDLNEMYCIYSIDGNTLNKRSQIMPHNGSFHFDLDLSDLEEGLHQISFMLHSDRGASTNAQTQFFVKIPLGGNGIDQYQYWLNDDDISQATTIALPQKVNPLQLVSLLPVESRPLRSSLFHFDVSNGKPMIYAMNTIHLRFHDVAQRFSDVAKDYADYSKNREVEPVGELQVSQTFQTLKENDIRWYTMQSAPGDTAAFRLSQPATVQVFAPSGAEVFKTSEAASVNWGGIHTWEDGTYYLAVHDVTGSKDEITLEYMHMDKFDVVDWDVHTVGNGGCSTITFKGNGFRDLYAVDLVIAPGDTIRSVDVSHDSDAETAIAFDFTAATLGDYNAIFHFTEENKPIANAVTVEEAVDIKLATDVTFPSSFLRGTSTTYTIKITNKGNMTAYNVPFSIKIYNSSNNDISHVALDGLGLKKLFNYIEDFEGWTQSEIAIVKQLCDAVGEDHYFLKLKTVDNQGDSLYVRTGLFGLNVPPNATRTIYLTLTTPDDVSVWVAVANGVLPISSYDYTKHTQHKAPRRGIGEWFCCHYEQIACVGSIVASVSDIASVVVGPEGAILASAISCATGLISQTVTVAGTAFCDDNWIEKSAKERLKAIYDNISIVSTLMSCLSHSVNNAKMFMKWFEKLLSNGSLTFDVIDSFSCIIESAGTVPCCDGNCGGGGGTSTSVTSLDPNDIYGYLSQAGSRFIADSVARVNYTIEFENDTAFATAAAHTIVIRDTLDSRYFELTKFMPTGVRIGSCEAFLNEDDIVTKNDKTSFVKTIDMRPAINAIAQAEGDFDQKKGIAEWRFTSLDPMTMEPTDDLMQGILPVNYDGTSGIGEVMFEVGVKPGKADGTELSNRAGIVFDYEEAILTPTWTNIVDAVPPTSIVSGLTMLNDSTLRVMAEGEDARSGVWKYEWYVRHGENAPWWKEGETDIEYFDFHFYEGFDYAFCVVATDSAGNVERKERQAERIFKSYGQDFEDSLSPLPASTGADGRIYDLSGRRHGESREGINIINRKKVLFRRKQPYH